MFLYYRSFASNYTRAQKEQARLDRKISLLIEEKVKNSMNLDTEKIIKNYSNYNLTDPEKNLLSKGLNFAVLPSRLNYADYCLNFELFYRQICQIDTLNNRNKDFLHTKIKDLALSSFREYHQNSNVPGNLSKSEFNALKKLSNNNDLIVQKADKGNCVVIINKDAYLQSINNILADRTKFEPITFRKDDLNHLLDMEKKVRLLLNEMREDDKITQFEYNSLLPIGSRPGILYGLPKVHKKTVNGIPPFRPILSAIGTPTYLLSKFLVPIMSPITTNEHSISNSFSFAREISEQDPALYMASLDVDSLFTSIPLDETIEIAVTELFQERDTIKNLNKDDFRKLLELATKESCFLFDGKYFRQTDGVAMGNPLGPTMANIFMCNFERKWLDSCPAEFKPVYYRRYVDDTCVLFKKEEHIVSFKNYLNSCHRNINFTYEKETDNSLPFLDIKILRENNTFATSIFRKETFTGLYTNYKSLIPSAYKKGLIFTLLFRIVNICSSWSLIHTEFSKLKEILRFNGYPTALICRCIKTFLDRYHGGQNNCETEKDPNENIITLFLPYLGESSLKLKRAITKHIKNNIPNQPVRVIFSSKRRLSNFFRFKDVIPKNLQSHLVYKINCAKCNLCYYGLTERHLKVRSYDHMGMSYLTGKPIKGVDTAMKSHCRTHNHYITMDSISILTRESNSFHLKIKESLLIKRDRPILNNNVYSTPLMLF